MKASVDPAVEQAVDLDEAEDTHSSRGPSGLQEATIPETPKQKKDPDDQPAGFLAKLRSRLTKTRASFIGGVDRLVHGKKTIDDELLEDLEELLVTSDLGVRTTMDLVESIQKKVNRKELVDPRKLRSVLQEEILNLLNLEVSPLDFSRRPTVIMVVGVNGTGKTTTIGKLARRFRNEGRTVMLAAADTFRAAAIEQLEVWATRSESSLIKHQHGSDPSAVAYDAIEAARARQVDVLIIDTAGRLHTQKNLMEQLKKMHRVIAGRMEGAPHEVLLVLDSTTGQNALSQAKLFHEALGVTGLVLTKLDGTAKGGIVVAILREMGIPIRFIGIGEAVDDLRDFDPPQFVEAIFKE
ncbi:MAG: signal recognition particle-docking protein FtsY [Deltaproteobacteria bacterium]|nr:signal recognition particle-docking protein FtsY [Deltaproteobacteria bacterium]